MIEVKVQDLDTVELKLSGDVTAADYQRIRPELENIFAKRGRQKFLFNMLNVSKFNLGAVYEDIKFDLQHFRNIGTTAVVSTKAFAEKLTKFVDMIYPVKIEYFRDVPRARTWLGSTKA